MMSYRQPSRSSRAPAKLHAEQASLSAAVHRRLAPAAATLSNLQGQCTSLIKSVVVSLSLHTKGMKRVYGMDITPVFESGSSTSAKGSPPGCRIQLE